MIALSNKFLIGFLCFVAALLLWFSGSVGISVLFTQVARTTQTEHARIGEHVTSLTDPALLPQAWNWSTTGGAMILDAAINRQAACVAYLNSFTLMAVLATRAIPLCFLLRQPARQTKKAPLDAIAAE